MTLAPMMRELSSHLASSLCVSVHALKEAPPSPSTGLRPHLLRPSCVCKTELVGLQEQEAASANAQAPNTSTRARVHTNARAHTHTRWDLSLLGHLQQFFFPRIPVTSLPCHFPDQSGFSASVSGMYTASQSILYFLQRAWPTLERGGNLGKQMGQG